MLVLAFSKFKTYVGVELHIQLNYSVSKLFTKGVTGVLKLENSLVDGYSLGVEGVLPLLNNRILLKMNCLGNFVKSASKKKIFLFDRKNYMYPDLPKGYQITQDSYKFCEHFKFHFFSTYTKKIEVFFIKSIQLEEDVASFNKITGSYDYNRSGFPLMELVSDKLNLSKTGVITSFIDSIKAFFIKLKLSSCSMHKGEFRCDLNISTFSKSTNASVGRVEVKNLNSNSAIRNSLLFEKYKQFLFIKNNLVFTTKLKYLRNVTKGWSTRTLSTTLLRYKGSAEEYNFFIEPDLPVLTINKGLQFTHVETYYNLNSSKNYLRVLFFLKVRNFRLNDSSSLS